MPRKLWAALLVLGLALALARTVTSAGLGAFVDEATVADNTFATGTWTTLYASGDTYLTGGQPNQNQGTDTFLRVQQSGSNRSLVIFDSTEITNAAGGRTLRSATLQLYIETNGDNWGGSGRTVDAHRITTSWTELGATWNCPDDTNTSNGSADCPTQWNGGSFDATATDSFLITNGLTGWVEWDVTADVAAFLASTAANYGWIIKKTSEGAAGQVDFTSREGAANDPELYLVFQ
ncbi:MAG: hypothetical protein A2148_07885 [Chloroflexi bacterium RBG_16_68_14]|nr:MAG: hypothetical protein A2148_07885 [Chloroflexi bacterium RBG_16_68_14]